MSRSVVARVCWALAAMSAVVSAGRADVFEMPSGLTSMAFVPVGNAGNDGQASGKHAGGYGPDAVVGSVGYNYSLGTYEVTAGQYVQFLNAVAGVDTYSLYNPNMADPTGAMGCNIQRQGGGTAESPYAYSVDAAWANRPVNYVNWGDAARFANWLTHGQPAGPQGPATTEDGSYLLNGATGNTALLGILRKSGAQGGRFYIPTEDEWYKGAYHKNDGVTGNYWNYPTRSNQAPGQDVTEATGAGNNANWYTKPYAWPIEPGHYTTAVGEFDQSAGPYGTFDQGGNVWEWNEAVLYGMFRGMRGGSFSYYGDFLGAADRYDEFPVTEDFDIGFRLSQVLPAHPGDANGDGAVDLQDFGSLKDHFGAVAGGTWASGDFTGDGKLDLQDFGVLKDHFGHTAGDSPTVAVPEPLTATAVTLAAGFLFGLGRPGRRRRGGNSAGRTGEIA